MGGGRPKAELRSEFTEVFSPDKIAAKTDKNYDLVRCDFCLAMHTLNPTTIPKPPVLSARLGALTNHLKNCDYAVAAKKGGDPSNRASPFKSWKADYKEQFHELVFNFIAENKLPPTVTASRSFERLVDGICSGAAENLPSCYKLGNTMLDTCAKLYNDEATAALHELQATSGGRVSVLSDGWMNVSKKHVVGSQLALFGTTLTLPLKDAGTDHKGLPTAELLEQLILESTEAGFIVGSLGTDDAGQCSKARKYLRPRWPRVVFIACTAHAMNNLVKQVLKLPTFRVVTQQASAAANALKGSSAKWLPLALSQVTSVYEVKELMFHTLCATRWNSMQSCFASLLRVYQALMHFHRLYHAVPSYPDECDVFGDRSFWSRLRRAEKVIQPLAAISLVLQKNSATLGDVVHAYRKIYVAFAAHDESGAELIACVESRWSACEQPLFLLGYFLHPKYRFRAAEIKRTGVTVYQLHEIAIYYYRRLVGDDAGDLLAQLIKWTELKPLAFDYKKYGSDAPLVYWKCVKNGKHALNGPELADLAIVVHSVCVNTASCERLFSDLGGIHTKSRNRMHAETSRKWHLAQKRVRAAYGTNKSERKRQRVVSAQERKRRLTPVTQLQEPQPPASRPQPLQPSPNHLEQPANDEERGSQPTVDEDGVPEDTVENVLLGTFAFWQRAADLILDDPDVAEEYLDNTQDSASPACTIDPEEPIEINPERGPFHEGMEEEKNLVGTRGVKWALAALFPLD